MTSLGHATRAKRNYNFACTSCRRRKAKCGGQKPRCLQCEQNGEICVFLSNSDDVSATTSKAAPLEVRVRRIEALLGIQSSTAPSKRLDAALWSEIRPAERASIAPGVDDARYHLSVAEGGDITYHGTTSLVHGGTLSTGDDDDVNDSPTSTAPQAFDSSCIPLFQALAFSKHISVLPQVGSVLLDAFFCYSSPLYNVVHRGLFTRDMALGGPFFSNFLLMALYASGTRMIDGLGEVERTAQGNLLAGFARTLLATELEGSSKVTTIQGLLVLSGRECAVGNSSQGWLYAGMAFRMIQDMGIHLSSDKAIGATKISSEDRMIRNHLFWSAFTWDKTISLALGREPAFPLRPGQSPDKILVPAEDSEDWKPFFALEENMPQTLQGYQMPGHIMLTFRWLSRLNIIIHTIINALYGAAWSIAPTPDSFARDASTQLSSWYAELPPAVKLEADLPFVSPPPHIFSLNLLLCTAWVLLYRPFIPSDSLRQTEGAGLTELQAYADCKAQAERAYRLVVMFGSTFGFSKMSYVVMYGGFVAAGFELSRLKDPDPQVQQSALDRVQAWLEILDQGAIQGPSIRRSITTIRNTIHEHSLKHGIAEGRPAWESVSPDSTWWGPNEFFQTSNFFGPS